MKPDLTRREFAARVAAILPALGALSATAAERRAAHAERAIGLVPVGAHGRYDVLGPLIEFFTPEVKDADFTVLQGTLPPRGQVPLHSHPDDESFLLLAGKMQGLVEQGSQPLQWFDVPPSGFVHVPKNAKHAWRNVGPEPVVQLIVTSRRLGRFFREAGRPLVADESPRAPTPEEFTRFTAVAARYGHWLATPEENAAVGIRL